MLRRIVGTAGTLGAEANASAEASREVLSPTRLLNGFGAFGAPPPTARPVPANYTGRARADNPPGFYGPPEGLLAVNTLLPTDRPKALDVSPLDARIEAYRLAEPADLRGPVFLVALGLLLIDALVVFWLAGGIYRLLPRRRVAASLVVAISVGALAAMSGVYAARAQTSNEPAQSPPAGNRVQPMFSPTNPPLLGPSAAKIPDVSADAFASKSTLETRLAYVLTGDAEVDAVSKAGLQGLTIFLGQHTALEAGEPIGLDIARDELAFFPLIYWPIVPNANRPSPQALAKIDAYMKNGGTVLFDTRDAVMAPPGTGGENRSPGMIALRGILSSLDIPELEPIPRDHVLTKTFYLLRDFPGRFNTGQLWVESIGGNKNEENEDGSRPARGGDGVSSIIITSNDLAGAWAQRPDGQPMLPLSPGEPRQRQYAFRAGVNIVMYTLTGNYKADQVHVPALLERLGQ